ncbi:hypothetical protein N7E02_01700 (plasmid) [Aliirhizobium terrae]|nr:hypothetical protein [Rhizobium sp. CC-CFT758]WJH38123.1 hypothetical protein N7E02_01700 [Rhizobium sp. CC-CFT758]
MRQQAYVLAYNDAFFATFLLAVGAIALLLLNVLWNHRHRVLPAAAPVQPA